MGIADIVERTIELAEARRRSEPRTGSVDIDELLSPPKGADKALMNFLDSLSKVELFTLLTLMYIGRDVAPEDRPRPNLDAHWKHNVETFGTKELAVGQMCEKSPLGKYLRDGKTLVSPEAVMASCPFPKD